MERQIPGMGGKLEELVRQRTQGRASLPILEPTLAENTQQQGAGTEHNVQHPLVLLHDGEQLLQHRSGPWQACRYTGQVRHRSGWAVTQT